MATAATFSVGSDEFPLGTVFEQLPDATVELDRVVPCPGSVEPYVWVRHADVDDVQSAFSPHPGIADIQFVDSVGDRHLLRAAWEPSYDGVMNSLSAVGLPLLSATGTGAGWTLKVRGDRQSDIADFQHQCWEREIPVDLKAMHELTSDSVGAETGLTDSQWELLTLAHRRGYFDSPRGTTMESLGDELGISQQAVASRLRRALQNLLDESLPESG